MGRSALLLRELKVVMSLYSLEETGKIFLNTRVDKWESSFSVKISDVTVI